MCFNMDHSLTPPVPSPHHQSQKHSTAQEHRMNCSPRRRMVWANNRSRRRGVPGLQRHATCVLHRNSFGSTVRKTWRGIASSGMDAGQIASPTGERRKAGRSMPEKKPRAKYNKRGIQAEPSWFLGSSGHVPHGGSAVGLSPVFFLCALAVSSAVTTPCN